MSNLKLIRVEIEHFRKFQSPKTINITDLSDKALDYLVIAGPNGSGKSTVLEAILLALGKDELIVRDLESRDRPSSPRTKLDPNTKLTISLRNEKGQKQSITRSERGWIANNNESMPEKQAPSWLQSLDVEYFSSRRLPAQVGSLQDSVRGRPPADTETNRVWRLKYRIRQQQGRRVPGYVGPEPQDQAWIDRLNRFWRQFRGDDTSFTMTLVDSEDLDANEWDLFLYRGKERICAIDALSSGEQEVIAMVAPFITERFDGVLLIDEPELHLHPEWQRRIVPALREVCPKAQFIVATHAAPPWDDAMSWERELLVEPNDPRVRSGKEDA